MRNRAPKTCAPSTYRETIYTLGSIKLTLQLAGLDAEAHQRRDEILRGILRYLAEDPTVRSLLAADVEKALAFQGGLAEVVNGMAYAEAWEGDAGEITAQILREGARRGKVSLYLASGRDSMSAALG